MLNQIITAVLSVLVIVGSATGSSVAAEKKALKAGKAVRTLTAAPPTVVAPPTGGIPLTSGECTGLGGHVVDENQTCNAKGQKACKTVDHHGVVRVACIDEVKN